jgi:glycosyltransferase involved in cell wall biosynthesis
MNKKIIHITLGKVNPERSNGINKVVNSLITCQVNAGMNVEFWGISFSTKHNYPKRNYATRLFMDSKNKFLLDPNLKLSISELNKETTVCHIHGSFSPQLYSVVRLLRKNNIPYIFTPHGGYNIEALKKSKFIKRIYMHLFEKHIVNNSKHVQLLVASEIIGTEKYFTSKNTIIPNGQELNIKSTLLKNKSLICVGFIGRIDIRTKGLDILLKGIKAATSEMNIQLEIIGANGEIETLKKMVTNLGLQEHVQFKGAHFGNDKLDLISKWDALCLTSRYEGLPGVVLEAGSVGVPSIVSKETNMLNYIELYKSGWVLQQNTPDQILNALIKIKEAKDDTSYATYRDSAYKMIKEQFDWNYITKQLAKLYG